MSTVQQQLQARYEMLATNVARSLQESVWMQMKDLWEGILSPGDMTNAQAFILSLLEKEEVSLLDISKLKLQLVQLGSSEGVKFCQQYEEYILQLCQVPEESCGPCNVLHNGVHTKRDIPIANEMFPEEDDERLHVCNLPVHVPTKTTEYSSSCEVTQVCALRQKKQTLVNGMAILTQDDQAKESINLPLNEPLRSWQLSSIPNLQISSSTMLQTEKMPGSEVLWSEEVLSTFIHLPDFSSADAEVLTPLHPCTQMNVKEFLLSFQRQTMAYKQLRKLSEKLKSLNRTDVVDAMHQQRNLVQWLGPVVPEERPIKDMSFSKWIQFTTALSVTKPKGNDWRWLADKLGIPRHHVDLWQQRSPNPAEKVLKTWEVKVSEAITGRLFDLMIEMEREDLASML